MPIDQYTTRNFHRRLYSPAGMLETVTLYKRGDNQLQGTVVSLPLYNCRHSRMEKTGETVQGDMNAFNRCVWHLPVEELDRVGVNYLNPLDRIVDKRGWWWQPESDTEITLKLIQNHVCVVCKRVDPPRQAA